MERLERAAGDLQKINFEETYRDYVSRVSDLSPN
jgi:hypothetical protein